MRSLQSEICIQDSGTTHTILRQKRYFSNIKPTRIVVNTISGPADVIEGTGKANFTLPNGTHKIHSYKKNTIIIQ